MASEEDYILLGPEDIEDVHDNGLRSLSPSEIQQIQGWLSPTDYSSDSSEYHKHLTTKASDTGNWLMESKEYIDWHDSTNGKLLLKGIPGSGKSVLAASLIYHLSRTEVAPVLYFFFRQTTTANKNPGSLVRDWMSQLLEKNYTLQYALAKLTKAGRSLDSVSFQELWQMLVSALKQCPRVYCIIDALDEMDQHNQSFLTKLACLGAENTQSIKLLMTSRPLPYIERSLQCQSTQHLVLQPAVVDPDISVFVQQRLERAAMNEINSQKLHKAICGRANGLFLYAKLMTDEILDLSQKSQLDYEVLTNAMDQFPTSLSEFYAKMLADYSTRSGTPQALQVEILQVVTLAERPMRLLELASLFEFKKSYGMTREVKAAMKVACGPLLEIIEDESVRIIHHSLTEFLYGNHAFMEVLSDSKAGLINPHGSEIKKDAIRSKTVEKNPETETPSKGSHAQISLLPSMNTGQTLVDDMYGASFPTLDYFATQRALGLSCLQFLRTVLLAEPEIFTNDHDNTTEFGKCRCSNQRQYSAESKWKKPLQDLKLKHPFFEYAAHNWCKHFAKYNQPDAALHLILDEVMFQDQRLRGSLIDLLFPSRHLCQITPAHIAAHCGLSNYINYLLGQGHDVEAKDCRGQTPIFYAAEQGHDNVVAVLISNGAQIDIDDHNGYKPLMVAAQRNRHKVVKLLLEAGADLFARKSTEDDGGNWSWAGQTIGYSALKYTCQYRHVETLQCMMPHIEGPELGKALHWAIRYGSTQCALVLLQNPKIDFEFMFEGCTPLYCAAREHDAVTLRRLLDLGANPWTLGRYEFQRQPSIGRFTDPKPHQPIIGLAMECVEFNRTRLVDLNGFRASIELLLDAGCDVNATTAHGANLLHVLALGGFMNGAPWLYDIIRLLIDRGANVAALDNSGCSILHKFCHASPDILELLTQNGADVNAVRPSDGKTPLILALERHPQHCAKVLIDCGADVNLKGLEGWTPLHFCAHQSNVASSSSVHDESVFEALFKAGADPNARTHDGETVLHVMRNGLQDHILQSLVERGLDIESRNNKGDTALMEYASSAISEDSFQKLMQIGASIYEINNEGLNILHLSLGRRSGLEPKSLKDRLCNLVQRGVDPIATDNAGNTLLHYLARNGWYSGGEGLLDKVLGFGVSPFSKNNQGRTVLHVVFSYNQARPIRSDLAYHLLEKHSMDINAPDNHGIRPIHLAASCNALETMKLLDHGADATVQTREGQSLLMIACRIRDCNLLGLLIDYHMEHGQSNIIELVDNKGRSALHYACIAGRYEAIEILLNSGANPNIQDRKRMSPLHALVESFEEQKLWKIPNTYGRLYKRSGIAHWAVNLKKSASQNHLDTDEVDAVGLSRNDDKRPTIRERSDPLTIRESLRLLVKFGADVSFLSSEAKSVKTYKEKYPYNPLTLAIKARSSIVVDELLALRRSLAKDESPLPGIMLRVMKSTGEETEPTIEDYQGGFSQDDEIWQLERTLWGRRLELQSKQTRDILSVLHHKTDNVGLIEELLEAEDDQAIEEWVNLGADLFQSNGAGVSPIDLIVQWGFATVLRKVCARAGEMTVIPNNSREPNAMLAAACGRELPNTRVLEVLVEDFGLDINQRFSEGQATQLAENGFPQGFRCGADGQPIEAKALGTMLHVLARSQYWWQPRAIEYLATQGADIESRDSNGDTPLLCAVNINAVPQIRRKAVETLLGAGADPNVLDKNGLTCLNRASRHVDIVRILIEHGADPALGWRPCLNSATMCGNMDVLRYLISLGVDCNSLASPPAKSAPQHFHRGGTWEKKDRCYPLHLAACFWMHSKPTSAAIIEVLLKAGANPLLVYPDGKSVIHSIAEDQGVLKPFLKISIVELEARDSEGKTLLLAGCCPSSGVRSHEDRTGETVDLLLSSGASALATDNVGRNALHCILSSETQFNCVAKAFDTLLARSESKMLVSMGDNAGSTPLHYAFREKIPQVIDALVEQDANLLQPDPFDRNTALHFYATQLFDAAPIDGGSGLFITPGCPKDKDMRSWIEEQIPYLKTFRNLVARGMDINARNHNGDPPLFHFVARQPQQSNHNSRHPSHVDLLYIFEEAGADFAVRNNNGESALHRLASHSNSTDLFKALLDKGCDPMWEDEGQRTCLDIAATYGNTDLVKLFQK